MADDRCYGCCQENCGSGPYPCSCSCHRRNQEPRPILPMPKGCDSCGAYGAHYCPGPRRRSIGSRRETELEWREIAKEIVQADHAQNGKPCPDHKRYQAIRRPRVNCEACWRLWIFRHPG